MSTPNRYRQQRRRRRAAKKSPTQWVWILIIVAVVAVACYAYDQREAVQQPTTEQAVGSASAAQLCQVVIPADLASTPVNYTGMTMSFNPQLHIPNYVAWELTADEARGTVPRANNFLEDTAVRGSATPDDYRNSGYDRGHICPAGDAKWSADAMQATFYMTNMCPQAKALNTGAWKSLEEKCRTWAQRDSALVIIAGPIVADRLTETIGATGVAVPRRFFKVIYAPYANPPRAIGFIMNNGKVPGGMQAAAVSVDQVEAATGYDFFAALPDELENAIEAECKFHLWSNARRR